MIGDVANPQTGDVGKTVVVSFNIDVDRVLPHMATAITPEEVKQLQLWLDERAAL